mgnify:CR=1 FL=1
MKKKVCVLTGARSEYGLLKPLLKEIKKSNFFDLELAVTGSHLSKKYGYTVNEILKDSFRISHRVNILSNDDSVHGINLAISKAISKFSQIFTASKPDILIVLGDRYEALGGAVAAMLHNIPIAHIHGGEATEGLIDEAIRHSLSKMSLLHFVATEKYRQRVIQLGESPGRVFNVGGMALDSIKQISYINQSMLEEDLGFKFSYPSFVVTYHPLTLDHHENDNELDVLLNSIEEFPDSSFLFTMPNADPGNNVVRKKIEIFTKKNKNSTLVESLGQVRFLSSLKVIDGIIGNSSSGLLEAPHFKIGTVNIGNRQEGREKALSVLDVKANKLDFVKVLEELTGLELTEPTLKTTKKNKKMILNTKNKK